MSNLELVDYSGSGDFAWLRVEEPEPPDTDRVLLAGSIGGLDPICVAPPVLKEGLS